MVNQQLSQWFKTSGFQERANAIAQAEEELTTVMNAAVSTASLEYVEPIKSSANSLREAALSGLEWLESNPCPADDVNTAQERAWTSYVKASETILEMASGVLPMTPESGETARQAIATAKEANYDAAMAFTEAIK